MIRQVVLVLLLAGCAPRPVTAPSLPVQRDEVRGAVLVAWEGLKVLHKTCVGRFSDLAKQQRLDEAAILGQSCARQTEEARSQLQYALQELDLWTVDKDCRCQIAGRMGVVVGAYEVLTVVLRSKSDEVDDGHARALWLATGCQ